MNADFLLTRGDDLLVAGVRMTGVSIDPPGAYALAGEQARLVLYLPPQHTVEEARDDAPPVDWIAGSQLSGVSRVAFDLAPGTQVALTAKAVLDACRRLSPVARPAGPFDSAIEIPWRLVFAPVADDGTGNTAELGCLHPDLPLVSPTGVVGTWMSRLGIRLDPTGFRIGVGEATPEFELVPVDVDMANTADPFTHSLTNGQRTIIVGSSGDQVGPSELHPTATELSVTSYGGSLSATGAWAESAWRHHATIGRDQRVIVTQLGYTYPFGLRVLFTTVVERRTEVPGATGPAALRINSTLRFLQQKSSAPPGELLSRAFPFTSVEVTQQVFGKVFADYFYIKPRPTPDVVQLKLERDRLQYQADQLLPVWQPLVNPTWSVESVAAWAEHPYGEAAIKYQEVLLELYPLRQETDAADAAGEAHDPVTDYQIRVLEQMANEVYAVFSALIGTPRPIENQAYDAANLDTEGSAEAHEWIDLHYQILELDQRIAAGEVVGPPVPVVARLRQGDVTGPVIEFPIRLRTRGQELRFAMPLLFVADTDLPATDVFPAYSSLDDSDLPGVLDHEWTSGRFGQIGLQGETVDLVGSHNPQPQDLHEIHAINILGPDPTPSFDAATTGRLVRLFASVLGREAADDPNLRWGMQVGVPALRALGSEVAAAATAEPGGGLLRQQPTTLPALTVPPGLPVLPGIPVHFDPEYLAEGETAKVLLKAMVDVPVDFRGHADRSGGLAAVVIRADAISRTLGPVQSAGLSDPDPSKLIGEGATLLGYKLQDLLKAAELGDDPVPPPTIVHDVRAGKPPVVTMKWENIKLRKHFALDTYPRPGTFGRNSLLTLSVVSTVDAVDTMCSVVDVDLVFPPEADVIRLTFSRLAFTQHTTPQHADPPHLDVGPIDITFERALTFVQGLQEAVALVGKGATILVRPTGIEAGFALPVPPVSCGVFNLSNVTFRAGIVVPFGGDPVVVSLAFSSRSNPFNLTVSGLGGGGYLVVNIQEAGPSIEASLDFGALVAINFGIASAEAHVLGGIRYLQQPDGRISLTGFIRVGGTVNLLGLISVSVELVVELTYDFNTNVLSGHATLVIELDLTLWSDKVELDSGTWTFLGGGHLHAFGAVGGAQGISAAADQAGLAVWRRYRAAFGVTS